MPQSYYAQSGGVFIASRYNLWSLLIVGGSYAAGSPQTFALATGSCRTRDGNQVIPFTVGSNLYIGAGSDLELGAVTGSSNFFPDSNNATCSINTANTHGQGELIQSGSYGLNEACAAALASPAGTGTVVIDSEWGGTNAMITAAKALFPAVSIVDYVEAGLETLTQQTVLSSTQLKALQTTAVAVAPAAGVGTMLVPLKMTLQYKFLTTTYTIANADNTFQIEYAGKSTLLMSVLATGVFDQAANAVAVGGLPAVVSVNLAQTNAANLGLEVKLTGTTPALTSGLGSGVLTLTYQVVPLQ